MNSRASQNGIIHYITAKNAYMFSPIYFREQLTGLYNRIAYAEMTEPEKDNISDSIGLTVTDPSSDRAIGEYMKIADDEMYRIKAARKKRK